MGAYTGGRPTHINEKGQAIGFVTSASAPDDLFQALPALWDKGHLTVLRPLAGGYGSAWDINDKGQVAGFNGAPDGTSLQPFQGCCALMHKAPRVALARNPGLSDRIPFGIQSRADNCS